MQIEGGKEYLVVNSGIYFGQRENFCGRPYIHLMASEKGNIFISIQDQDDFSIGMLYKPEEHMFQDVLHELINWMRDHEQGVTVYNQILRPYKFFPDCECERKIW